MLSVSSIYYGFHNVSATIIYTMIGHNYIHFHIQSQLSCHKDATVCYTRDKGTVDLCHLCRGCFSVN